MRFRPSLGLVALFWMSAALGAAAPASAVNLPPGFQAEALNIPRDGEGNNDYITGLQNPTALAFAPDGEMFVAEHNGRVKIFSSVEDKTPELFANLTRDVMGRADRGLLGLKLDPEFQRYPYVYLAYTYDAPIGGEAPTGEDDASGSDICDESSNTDCLASGRIVRIKVDPETGLAEGGPEHPEQKVLAEGWCEQFSSHSMGDIEFDSEGALLAGGGDGASWEVADNGQFSNPCGDPPREGGSERAQDLRTPETPSDPTGYNGTIIRINRFTGEPMPDNPLAGGPDLGARKILAYGLRNPFRFELRPGTNELYVGDVGWYTWEEIDRASSPPKPGEPPLNFGWPCYEGMTGEGIEGMGKEPEWRTFAEDGQAPLCQSLYEEGPSAVTPPIFSYIHVTKGLFEGDQCAPGNGSSISGLAFYEPGTATPARAFPSEYDGALFFADASRGCVWVMHPGPSGAPDPTKITNFATPDPSDAHPFTPVDITVGPEGALYMPNFFDDSIERIRYYGDDQPPIAKLGADRTFGADSPEALKVQLDASSSFDPEGEELHYSWDLNGDGSYGEGPDSPLASAEYSGGENVEVGVRVTDAKGVAGVAHLTLYPGDLGPPEPSISVSEAPWTVGEKIPFSGIASDPDRETPQLNWEIIIRHCPAVTSCHSHPFISLADVSHGEIVAPPHEYPSHLEMTLTATDERGLSGSATTDLYPRTVGIELESDPPGLPLTFEAETEVGPFEGTIIAGGNANISAPPTAELDGAAYEFEGWSDGGAPSHTISSTAAEKLVAHYRRVEAAKGSGAAPAAPSPTPSPASPSALHLRSKPPGALLRVGNLRRRAPFDLDLSAGEGRWVTAPLRLHAGGELLHFQRWTNDGSRRQWIAPGQFEMLSAIYDLERPTGRRAP